MAGEKFKLNFITNGEGIKPISEPTGFDSADFTLRQDTKKLARDVSFAGGESEFSFYPNNNHEFDLLIYYYETFGWESEVQLIIEINGFDNIIGDFDFFTANTNGIEYFSCKVVQSKKQALIKKRNDVKVDLFSDVDLDDNYIAPVNTSNILLRAKSITQTSKWVTSDYSQWTGSASDFQVVHQNGLNQINVFGIDDTLTPTRRGVRTQRGVLQPNSIRDFAFIKASDNISNLQINITGLKISFYITTGTNFYLDVPNNQNVSPWIHIEVGTDDDTDEIYKRIDFIRPSSIEFIGNQNIDRLNSPFTGNADRYDVVFEDYILNVGSIPRGFLMYVLFDIREPGVITEWLEGEMTITATSTGYSTVVPSVSLYDACEYNVAAVSQLPIDFKLAENGQGLGNQRLLNGNMLRGINNRPFYFSMKYIDEWLPEIYGDYEVKEDSVFFGIYKDFYSTVECGVFDTVKFEDYEKRFNKKLAINQFNYKYNKFQSQKENEVDNTYDVVHGESEWLVPNIFVENKKEVSVGFVRDSFLISETQKKALTISQDETTQDDDTIFIIDTNPSAFDFTFVETDFLQHTFLDDTGNLRLNNTGNFNFSLLGLSIGGVFDIDADDKNAGTYEITEINGNYIVLKPKSTIVSITVISSSGDGERITGFTYRVSKETAPFFSRGTQGFTATDNISTSNDYANLRFSIKRNIINYYSQYLASCSLWTKKAIKNTFYKNNPEALLTYQGVTTIEGANFNVSDPIVNTFEHSIKVITNFATYKDLENRIRTDRGYIRIVDNDEFVLKLYPNEMTFVNSGRLGELTIIGEEKHDTSLINITYNELPYITINENYRTSRIIYKEKRNKFYIFDENGKLLFKPTFWHKITVNNANATSKQQLIEWLTLIS